MNKLFLLRLACLIACVLPTQTLPAEPSPGGVPGWQTTQLHDRFYTEGASAGDIDGDGVVDLVAGPMWLKGPLFEQKFRIAPLREFPVAAYSDQFFSHVVDATGDGAADVIVIGFPGKAARLYVNPGHGNLDQPWTMREITGAVDNESAAITDLIDGGLPEIVCGRDGQYGYYQAGDNASAPWQWNPVTRAEACGGRFAHGLGVGDVDRDGRADILDRRYWWRQPERADDSLWQRNDWAGEVGGSGGAQIQVTDIDGDGDADIVTSLAAHGYGLAWFEQTGDGPFQRHDIMGSSSIDNPYGIVFSQLHAVALNDVDGDGVKDIITGKRYLAHGGKDVGGLGDPVLYWFRCVRDETGVRFVPHQIHGDAGVGVDVLVTDLDGDARVDVVTSSKWGLAIHVQSADVVADVPQKWQLSEGRDQGKYAAGLPADEAAGQVLVDDGFHVDLIASEPDLTQPIAMCFDAAGRIWVIEGHTYPQKAPEGEGRDRVIIFEDSDANGSFETRKVFLEGLNLASAIEVGFGGVWVGAAPELLFIPDADRDDVPDGDPQVVLDGWGFQDTHETLNSFTWGPDGWLYGCHGVFTHSRVGKPGSRDADRVPLNAGVWRYHPTHHVFEVFAHGTSNPWGVDFNDYGDWFVSACVIPHLYHMQQGGRYQRQAGKHFNPSTYDDIKTIADHAHYTGSIADHAFWGDNKINRPAAALDTSILGGGHAHCGLAIYNADVFPPEYRGDLYFHNLHGHRVVRERVVRDGSGYSGQHRPDFALARDHNEIGVGIMVGPDGALYTSDWHDTQTCHMRDPEVWDRSNGRLFRIRYGDLNPTRINLWEESDVQVVTRISSNNGFIARQAQRILQERAATGMLDRRPVITALDQLAAAAQSGGNTRDRLRSIWTRYAIGGFDQRTLVELTADGDQYVRGWAVHLLGDLSRWLREGLDDSTMQRLAGLASQDDNRVVRRHLASLLQSLPTDRRAGIIEGLTSHTADDHDRNLPYLVWYGLEPLADLSPDWVLRVAKKSGWRDLYRFAVRRTASTAAGRSDLAKRLAQPDFTADRQMILEELLAAAKQRGGVAMPPTWPAAFDVLAQTDRPAIGELTRQVAVQFGDPNVAPYFAQILNDASAPTQQRVDAMGALIATGDPELPVSLFRLLDDRALAAKSAAALAGFDHPQTADQLLRRLDRLDPTAQSAALATLVSRLSFAIKLVDHLESGKLAADQVPAYIISQALQLGDDDLTDRLQSAWGRIATTSAEKSAELTKYQAMLTPASIQSADASRGRVLYETNCGKCHKLFGTGGDIGPDITGANRTDVNYWLENILDPNALIGRAYQTTTFLTDDGRVLVGMVTNENDQAITVQTATEQIVLAKATIDEHVTSETSLMPEGQLQPMDQQQVRDLMKYLTGPRQVMLPGQDRRVGSPDETIEAETMPGITVTAGTLLPQNMRGFGDAWSGNRQLWWTGGKPGDHLTATIPVTEAGRYDLAVHLTTARDYGEVQITVDGQPPQLIDLYAPDVTLAAPVIWSDVKLLANQKLSLTIKITGANQQADTSFMVGIDAIEVVKRGEDR